MDGSWPCGFRLEDGTNCPQILNARAKFCPDCGTKNTPTDRKKVSRSNQLRYVCEKLFNNLKIKQGFQFTSILVLMTLNFC